MLDNKLIPRNEFGSDLLPLFLYIRHIAAFSHSNEMLTSPQMRLIKVARILQANGELPNNSVGMMLATALFLDAVRAALKTSSSAGASVDTCHSAEHLLDRYCSQIFQARAFLIFSVAVSVGDFDSPSNFRK